MKKQERKENYQEILSMMLKGQNKQAFDALCCMCGKDTGYFLLVDYDKVKSKLEVAETK